MPRRARRISKRSAISTAVSRYWRHCPKGRLGTDGRSSCNWPAASSLFTTEGFMLDRGGRGLCPRPRAGRAAGRYAPAVHGGLRPLAIDQRCRQGPRVPRIVRPAAATDRGQRGRRIASAGASQRLDDLLCLPASRRLPASTARRGAGSMIPSGTAPTACSMAGTTPACARATSVRKSIGCSGIPRGVWRLADEALALAERIAHPFSLVDSPALQRDAPP